MLIKIIKNYNDRSFEIYSPKNSMKWGDYTFTEDKVKECDYIVVLNTPKKREKIISSPNNTIAIMQEPYHKGDTDWMDSQLEPYKYIFTNHIPSKFNKNSKIIKSHGALPWHVLRSYDELKAITNPPNKTDIISCIASNLTRWPGHKKRVQFINYIKQNNILNIDFYGKGTKFIEDKWNAIAQYKYSIVIENNDIPDYWTEKISDVYLGYTLPFYFGCTNLDKYFPKNSYIWIDINNPENAMQTIHNAINNNEWEKRLPSIIEARNKVLDEYNLLPFIVNFIKTIDMQTDTPKETVMIKPFQYDLKTKIQRFIQKNKNKILKLFGLIK
ncbi:MAG: glycosyltransferase family 10 [Campylobacterota bacterium]